MGYLLISSLLAVSQFHLHSMKVRSTDRCTALNKYFHVPSICNQTMWIYLLNKNVEETLLFNCCKIHNPSLRDLLMQLGAVWWSCYVDDDDWPNPKCKSFVSKEILFVFCRGLFFDDFNLNFGVCREFRYLNEPLIVMKIYEPWKSSSTTTTLEKLIFSC